MALFVSALLPGSEHPAIWPSIIGAPVGATHPNQYDRQVSPTGRRVRRLTILAFLGISLTLWRNRMIARNERALDQQVSDQQVFDQR